MRPCCKATLTMLKVYRMKRSGPRKEPLDTKEDRKDDMAEIKLVTCLSVPIQKNELASPVNWLLFFNIYSCCPLFMTSFSISNENCIKPMQIFIQCHSTVLFSFMLTHADQSTVKRNVHYMQMVNIQRDKILNQSVASYLSEKIRFDPVN